MAVKIVEWVSAVLTIEDLMETVVHCQTGSIIRTLCCRSRELTVVKNYTKNATHFLLLCPVEHKQQLIQC